MSKREIRVPVRYYLRLADVLARFGVDINAELRARKVSINLTDNPDAMLRFSQVESLIKHLNQRTGRSDLGYELGKELSVSTHSIVGFGMLSSPTVAQALQFIARSFQLVMPSFRLQCQMSPECAELHFTPVVAMGHECLAFHLEAIGMAALRDVRDLNSGRAPLCRLSHSIPRPPHARRYAEVRGLEVAFSAESKPGVRLLFEGDLRQLPLNLADPNALKVAESRCRAQVAHVARVGQFADWVAMMFREVSDGLPSLPELAATLNISPRTLNRYLEREGTSFRELAGHIQHEIARERLIAGEMTVTEVAYSLGFRDPANFTRSFRDREGISPRDFSLKARREPGGP